MTDPTYRAKTVECRWCHHVEPLTSDGIARLRRHTRTAHRPQIAALRERIIAGPLAGSGEGAKP